MVSSRNRKTHAAPARRQGGELRGVLRVFGILLALLPGLAGVLFAEDWPTAAISSEAVSLRSDCSFP